jgi:rhomboid protease GluP
MSLEPPRQPAPPDPGEPRETEGQPRAEVVRVALRLPTRQPVVVYALLGITILTYVLQLVSQAALGGDYPAALGMKYNAAIIAGEYWRLLTPMLLHGSITHLLFNMYALFSFGRELERLYGHSRFLLLYLIGALAGNVLSFLLSSRNSLGASTAVFGLVAAQGVTIYLNRRILGGQARAILGNIGFVIFINLAFGFTTSGIDNWGHLGGLLGGGVYALLAGPLFAIEGFHPNLKLVDRRAGALPYLAALVEATAFFLIASFKM